jgi:hypothetical protein
MRRTRNVVTAVAVFVAALGTGVYLWVQAEYVLPGASCGAVSGAISDQTRLFTGASRTPYCFVAAARTCAAAGIRIHVPGTENSTDYVWVINAGGVPGRCLVTEYSQELSFLGPGRVEVTECREASLTGKGVMLSCPNLGPILIPPAVAGYAAGPA